MQQAITHQINFPVASRRATVPLPATRLSLLDRAFVWSLVLEPLLFFVLFERSISGITSNLGRLLQILVVVNLMFKLALVLLNSRPTLIRVPNLASPLFSSYAIYFVLAILAGLIGFLSGAYDLPRVYDSNASESLFSRLLNSGAIRPLMEHAISLYYFGYFAVLPLFVLKTEKHIEYFFSIFKTVFVFSLVIGFIELAIDSGIYFIPRHFADGRYVGWRFHGLAGEPRDAFVYLFFGLAMLHLRAHFKGQMLNKLWIPVIVAAALLTQSASGLLGIVFFLGLFGAYNFTQFSLRQIMRLIVPFTIIIVLVYLGAASSERIMAYIKDAARLWPALENGGQIPYMMSVQMPNITPLYDLTVKLRDLNLVPVLIGSGLGSASVINNVYDLKLAEMANPYSQFVRVIFETGLIGTFFFVMSCLQPVKFLTWHLPRKKQREFILLTLLVLGCVFAQRSATIFIYLGIFIATFRLLNLENADVATESSACSNPVAKIV